MSYPTPRSRIGGKAGAFGGGGDESAALKRWLDDIAGKSGTLDRHYLTSQTLRPHPGTTIYVGGDGGGIGAHQSFPADKQLMHLSDGVRLFDLVLRGTPALREAPGAAMVSAVGDDILLHGCGLSWWRTLLAPALTNRLKLTDCDFSHWADSITLPERNSPEGKAIIAANAALPVGERKQEYELALRGNCLDDGGYALLGGNGSWPNDNVDVIGCTFHDGNWTAIDCLAPNEARWQIIDTKILRVKECGIYCGVSAIIERVTILGVERRDCSAHCIEGGGIGTRITHCTFGRPDAAIIFATNPRDLYIGHNTFFDPMEEAQPDGDVTPWSAALFARNVAAPPELLADGLVIEHNDIANARGKASYMVSMFDMGGGPFNNVAIEPTNRLHGPWKGGVLAEGPRVRGKNFSMAIKSAGEV